MTSSSVIRAVLALAIVAGSAFIAWTQPVKLGLDLEGGTQIVLETSDSPTVKAGKEATDRAVEVLRRRVDALGIAEPVLTRSGDKRIIVELAGVQDPRDAVNVIGKTAQLSFHPVLGVEPPEEAEDEPSPGASATPKPAPKPDPKTGEIVLPAEGGERLRLGKSALTGEGVADAAAELDTVGSWVVNIDFKGSGSKAWRELTGQAACAEDGDPRRRVAIALDGEVISSPQVDPSIACDVGITGGSTQITGSFDSSEAKDLALLIRGGALPVPVEVIEQRTVGATLGDEAIAASAKAAIIGITLSGLFLLVIYRMFGFLATVALSCYALISYATLAALGATLTLPGLAGFVLAIGMAIDANVLVFERAREEYAATERKGLRSAITEGFNKAWTAIIDSNVTTLLAAGLLFYFASGPVKGFGLTLAVGVIASMVSALLITRVLVEFAANRKSVKKRPQITGIANIGRVRAWINDKNPDIMKFGKRWLAGALIAVVIAIAGIGVRGLDFGVEFTGGRLVEYSSTQSLSVEQARTAVSEAGFPRAVVQESGDGNISVRTGELTNDEEVKVREALTESFGGEVVKERDELVGPSLGDELRRNALIALGIALLAQLAYLAIRFRWTFGASSVVAMAHDVLILIGLFAWLGKPIDGVFLAAVLTVIGYSVNDSVVVFDRVRELWTATPKAPFDRVTNNAVLQTVPRTINTGMGAVFVLGALLFLGGDSLADFALALLVGIIVGTYSSMFVASPLAIELEKRSSAPPPSGAKKKSPSAGGGSGSRKRATSGAVV